MPNILPAGASKSRRVRKSRSSRACQSCRAAKAKCELLPSESRCRRCLAASTTCFFPVSRRGRIKGSKNLRTLERLLRGNDQATSLTSSSPAQARPRAESCACSSSESELQDRDDEEDSSYRADTIQVADAQVQEMNNRKNAGQDQGLSRSAGCSRSCEEFSHRSGTATPWNPQNLVIRAEEGRQRNRRTLARDLLQILGEFPIEGGRSDNGTADSREFQDPLWLIAGLAQRGWDLRSPQGGRRRTKHPTVLPSTTLPTEDSRLLSKWSSQALHDIMKEQSRYFEHGILSSKCDVADALDPIHHGILIEERAHELFQAYWEMVHPQWAVLDPSLHTPASVRSRSALLTTTILALGSTALATLPQRKDEQVDEALRLHAHIEKLNLVVYASGARSIDIIQSQILLSRYGASPRTRLDELRWMRAGMIPRMASEIGLDFPRRYDDSDGLDALNTDKFRWNDLRTRGFMLINEYRFFTYSGRLPVDLSQFGLSDAELEEVTRLSRDRSATSLAAFYHLVLFERNVRERLEQCRSGFQTDISLDAELEHIKAYIENWIQEWCPGDEKQVLRWHLLHDALSCWLLLAIRIARKRSQPSKAQQQEQQQLLLTLSKRLFEETLKVPRAVHMTHRAAIFPVAASIILRLSPRRDLVLRLALRMSGEPGRPYVPTFVRESGNQMMVMLCTNNLRPPSPIVEPHDGQQHQPCQHSQGSEVGTSTEMDYSGTQSSNASRQTSDKAPTEDEQGAVRPNGSFQDMNYLQGFGLPFGTQADTNNIFALNSAYFPYVPDPTQPQVTSHNSMLPPYPSADLDALIGASVPLDFIHVNRSAHNGQFPAFENDTAMQTSPFSTAYGFPPEADYVASTPSQAQETSESSTWSMNELSPLNTAFAACSSGTSSEDRNAQRELLLASVGRLIQLASLMQ